MNPQSPLNTYTWLRCGMSSRVDGSMTLSAAFSQERREAYLCREGIASSMLVTAGLVHGKAVASVDTSCIGSVIPAVDGLVTGDVGVVLGITSADCLPVFCIDERQRVIGIAHAGWRGVVGGTIPELLRHMMTSYNSSPDDIVMEVGPSIGPCHFEITEELYDAFRDYKSTRHEGRVFADLWSMAADQARACGVYRVILPKECTFCSSEKYFSYRRDKPDRVETMLSWIEKIS